MAQCWARWVGAASAVVAAVSCGRATLDAEGGGGDGTADSSGNATDRVDDGTTESSAGSTTEVADAGDANADATDGGPDLGSNPDLGTPSPIGTDGCDAGGGDLILFTTYIDQRLFTFDVTTNEVVFVGHVPCSDLRDPLIGPYATAVDSDGMIWAHYALDSIYVIDPVDLSCEPRGFHVETTGIHPLSLAFATDEHGDERLFGTFAVGGPFGEEKFFGVIDTDAMVVEARGDVPGGVDWVSLSRHADGRLVGLVNSINDVPVALLEIDPADGSVIDARPVDTFTGWPIGFIGHDDGFLFFGNVGVLAGVAQLGPTGSQPTTLVDDLLAAAGVESIGLVSGAGPAECAARRGSG